MAAFASNSVLCRLALKQTGIDAASFTAIRLLSGAAMLWIIASSSSRGGTGKTAGSWRSALALFVYAAGFSWAYVSLPAATGALLAANKGARNSVSGVNLDDEAGDMIKFQQYYTASSQIIKAAQETFTTLINSL